MRLGALHWSRSLLKAVASFRTETMESFSAGRLARVERNRMSRAWAKIPGLRIAGNQHGYFESAAEVVQKINGSGADLLFVAMGSPRQEFWISEHMPGLNTCFCMGVGGSLDVISGATQRRHTSGGRPARSGYFACSSNQAAFAVRGRC